MPRPDPETLRLLRENSGLRLDAEGRFWHRGGLVEHERTVAVLHRGLHRAEDGRWATRIGSEWAWLEVEDTARFVQRIEPRGEAFEVELLDGNRHSVDPATLALGAADALYVRVDGERAKLTRAAQLSLAPWFEEHAGEIRLRLGARTFPIGRDGGPEPAAPR